MKLYNLLSAMIVLSTALFFQNLACGEIVYDSLSTTPLSYIGIRDVGNTITLSGSKRFVTSFKLNISIGSSSAGQTDDYVLRFYNPSAPNDYPGKLFWQSPPLRVVLAGGSQTITFDVPYVRVPDTFIFSVMEAGDASFVLCSGPTIGTSPAYRWDNLTKDTSSYGNHLQVRIEAQDRPDARLIGWAQDSSWSGIGGEDYYSMEFGLDIGGYWDMYGPWMTGLTNWDKGSFYTLDAADYPLAVDYLTNGQDQILRVYSEGTLSGNLESNTLVKAAGVANGHPDLYGCIIRDFVLKVDDIIIDHDTPGWTYFTSDVTWEIWGFEKSADMNLDGTVDFRDFYLLAAAWNTQPGHPKWNPACDISMPDNDSIGIEDLLLFSSHWLDAPPQGLDEGFETGDFSAYDWEHSGNANWQIVATPVYEGSHAAKSGTITHSQQSTLQVQVDVAQAGTISFYRKVSSESGYDFLRFYVDGVQKGSWSGTYDWAQASYPVTAGTHTFKWSYIKDGSVSSGSDCVWIDNIQVD